MAARRPWPRRARSPSVSTAWRRDWGLRCLSIGMTTCSKNAASRRAVEPVDRGDRPGWLGGFGGLGGGRVIAGHGAAGQSPLDHLEGQEVLALLAQDPAQAGHVVLVELAVARRGALRVEEPLALEEADLRDRDVGELLLQERQHLADRQVRPVGHVVPTQPSGPPPEKKTSLNLPICTSSPLPRRASSMRSRLRYVPFSEPTSRTR